MQLITSATGRTTHTLTVLRVPQLKGQSGICVIGSVGYSVVKTADGYDLTSDAGETHSVELWGKQALCSCKDWTYRGRRTGLVCKHISAAREMAKVETDAWTI